MSVTGPVPRGEHFVRFYEDDAHLYNTVGRFLREGLEAGEGVVVVATPEHTAGFERKLAAGAIDVAAARDRGDLILLDAEQTLRGFLVGDLAAGVLDTEAFTRVVGSVMSRLSKGPRKVRAYGEMVTLLVKAGNTEATVTLEEIWNELARTHEFDLCCAYPLDGFNRADHLEAFNRICAAHSHVVPAESYDRRASTREQDRQLAALQQRAAALEGEVAHRQRIEETLRQRERELADLRDSLLPRERAVREE